MVDDLTTTNVGASFNFGFATLGAAYEKNDYNNVDGKLATAYVTVPMGKGLVKAQYTKTGGSTAFGAKMFGVGYVYSMSKRTSLYTNYGSINNDGSATTGARLVTTGSGPAVTRGGETSTGYEFGIRHDF
jgi:predicted porin